MLFIYKFVKEIFLPFIPPWDFTHCLRIYSRKRVIGGFVSKSKFGIGFWIGLDMTKWKHNFYASFAK